MIHNDDADGVLDEINKAACRLEKIAYTSGYDDAVQQALKADCAFYDYLAEDEMRQLIGAATMHLEKRTK